MSRKNSTTWGGDNLGTSRLEKERVLQSAIDPILSRYYDEERVLNSPREIPQYRRLQEYVAGSSLAAIRHCRNQFIPVARLPPEILSRIFVFTTQMVRPEDWTDAARIISHVCRRWREIALDCPKLWSHIILNIIEVAGEGDRTFPLSPLSLLGHDVQWDEETTALVVSNMHRFISIDLCVPHVEDGDVDPAFEIFSQSAPMLQHLTFTLYHRYSIYAFHTIFSTGAHRTCVISSSTPCLPTYHGTPGSSQI
ncbi:hypothetical protein BD779DRAFT_520592 [Infundibulicybe gibba]|nr:hypothetical protein BD779DRAFT_520592 [Infundibulicybe gibba]